jgi:hypothetical protein
MSEGNIQHEMDKLRNERDTNVAELERFKDRYAELVSTIDFNEIDEDISEACGEGLFSRIFGFFKRK